MFSILLGMARGSINGLNKPYGTVVYMRNHKCLQIVYKYETPPPTRLNISISNFKKC